MKEEATVKILKIYCDTNALFQNIRHENEAQELAALESLLKLRPEKCRMFRSRVVRAELEKTKGTEQRSKLQDDYEALDQIPHDELPLGSFNITDHMGGCISNPIVSDYWDEPLYRKLLQRGLSDKDAHHITHGKLSFIKPLNPLKNRSVLASVMALFLKFGGRRVARR